MSGPRAASTGRCRGGSGSTSGVGWCVTVQPDVRKEGVHEAVAHGLQLSEVRDVVIVEDVAWEHGVFAEEKDVWIVSQSATSLAV